MSARDIMPWTSPSGGSVELRYGPMDASEVFEVGEPVFVGNTGEIAEFPDDGTEALIADLDSGLQMGIAAFGPGAGNIDPRTGSAFATGAEVAYWVVSPNQQWITPNFWATGAAGTAATPAQTDVGEAYQLSEGGAGWGVEQTAAVTGTDVRAVVQDVLDSDKKPIRISGNTGAYVVFTIELPTLGAA